MVDAHTHKSSSASRHFICEPFYGPVGENDVKFYGHHPWDFLENLPPENWLENLRERLIQDPSAGVGEIGLDRLKVKNIPSIMEEAFLSQLSLASELNRPVVLHGAKCWGKVVSTVKSVLEKSGSIGKSQSIPAFLFHGFSRSDGLIPEIISLNGFISVSSAILNDHAVNYRKMLTKIPLENLLVETDFTGEGKSPSLELIVEALAKIRGISVDDLEKKIEENADRFLSSFRA